MIYLETLSHLLCSPITFRPPRPIQFSSTKPANFTIELTVSLHRQSTHRQTTFQSIDRQLAKVFHPPTPCIAPIQPPDPASSLHSAVFPARSQVALWRSTTHRPTIGPTDPANGRLAFLAYYHAYSIAYFMHILCILCAYYGILSAYFIAYYLHI